MGGNARPLGIAKVKLTRTLRFSLPLAFALSCLVQAPLAPGIAHADTIDIVRGERLAADKCAKCHAVGPAGDSPQKGVPPFRALSKFYPIPMLEKTLATGVVDGHEEMPMFQLGFIDVRNLLAYIDSLNPGGPAYIKRP